MEPADFPHLQQYRERPNFLNCILLHEEGFTRNAVFNSHNTHIWADKTPHAHQEVRFQQRFSINVWAGVVSDRLVGPDVFLNRLKAA